MDKSERESFTKAVYDIVKTIPLGRATSYAAIARAVGYPNFSRLVGQVMKNNNTRTEKIPAHRVVNSQGKLSGKDAFGSGNEMQSLLESEGITVINDKIADWKTIYWNPIDEIEL